MKMQFRAGMLAVAILGVMHGTAWASTYEDGMAAFRDENYAQALSLLLPFAKEGKAEAAPKAQQQDHGQGRGRLSDRRNVRTKKLGPEGREPQRR